MMDEKKASLKANDNKFSKEVFVFEDSLETRLGLFQQKITELVDDDDHGLVVSTDLPTTSLNQPSNFSILLFNHDSGTFTQLVNSSTLPPCFEQPVIPCNQDYGTNYLDLLLAEQDMRSCNNFDLPIPPHPMMHTQTSMFRQFDHQFMQTQQGMIPYNQSSGYPTMMFS
ncbi:agamous-like MADS-box protein AGL93 [Raphanus sativus]|nr:agamous-like MADS-box protein AGL93 [Raphanus sativus]